MSSYSDLSMNSIEETEDITNFDDEYEDFNNLLHESESGGGTFKATFREFSRFEGEMHSLAKSVSGMVTETGEMIISAAPEGIFDDINDAFGLWGGEDPWEDEITKSTEKFTFAQQQLRMSNLALGNYDQQFYQDINNGLGLGQRMLDATGAQKQILLMGLTFGVSYIGGIARSGMAGVRMFGGLNAINLISSLGTRSIASSVVRSSGETVTRNSAVAISNIGKSTVFSRMGGGTIKTIARRMGYAAPGIIFLEATGYGMGKTRNSTVLNSIKYGKNTLFENDEEIEYHLVRNANSSIDAGNVIGLSGSRDITLSGSVEDRIGSNGRAVFVERSFYSEEGAFLGRKGYTLADYATENPSVNLDSVNSYSMKELVEISVSGGQVINSGTQQLPAKIDKVYINHGSGTELEEEESYLTYKFQGKTIDDKILITAEKYGNKASYHFSHYKTPDGTLVYSEIIEADAGNGSDISVAGAMIGGFRYATDNENLDYYTAVRTAVLAGDESLRLLGHYNAMKRVNYIHSALNSVRTMSQVNSGLISALQAFTFTTTNSGSVFDLLSPGLNLPLASLKMTVYEKQLKVADRMAILNSSMAILQASMIGGKLGESASQKLSLRNMQNGVSHATSNFLNSLPQQTAGELVDDMGKNIRQVALELQDRISNTVKGLNSSVDNANHFYGSRIGADTASSFKRTETFSSKTIASPMSTRSVVLNEIRSGVGRIATISAMSLGINVASGNYQVQLLNTISRELDIAQGFMLGSVYESLVKQAEHLLFNIPIVSGLYSGRTLAIVVTSFSFGNISRAIQNNELRSLKEIQKDIEYTFDRAQFGSVVDDIKSRMEKEGIAIDLRELVNTGRIHIRTLEVANGHSITSQTFATSSAEDLLNMTNYTKENIIKWQMKDLCESLQGKSEASRYFFIDTDEIKRALINDPELAQKLGFSVVKGNLVVDGELIDEEALYASLINGLSNGEYKKWYQTARMNADEISAFFSSDSAFFQKVSANEYLSRKIGVVYDSSGSAYLKKEIVEEFYEGDYDKYRADPDSWKSQNILSSPLSANDLRNRTLKFIKTDHGGVSNLGFKDGGEEVRSYYEDVLSNQTKKDEWTGTAFSKVNSENIRLVSVNSTKNFWVSFAIFSTFGSRDPVTMDGRYTFQAMRMRGSIHNNDVFSNIMNSVSTGVPMSLMGLPIGLLRQDYSDDWLGSMVQSNFNNIKSNIEFDDYFFEQEDNLNNENDINSNSGFSSGMGQHKKREKANKINNPEEVHDDY